MEATIIRTKRFGKLDIQKGIEVVFTEELLGFPGLRRFSLIISDKLPSFLRILQSLDDHDVSFILAPPTIAKKDYRFAISKEDRKELGITPENENAVYIYVLMVINDNFVSVNLKAPLIVNLDTHLIKQIILKEDYPVRYILKK